jgi:hypothetical protein
MAPFSGLLSAVSKAVPFVGGDTNVNDTEYQEPLLTDSDSAGYLGEGESAGKTSMQSSDVHRSVRQSNSDTNICAPSEAKTVASVGLSSPGAGLRPARPRGQRSSSNSQIERSSFARGTVNPETIRQRQIMARLSNLQRSGTLKRSKSRSRSGTGTPVAKTNQLTKAFEWRSATRSLSDPDLQSQLDTPSRPDLGKSLKTCLKQKAKSANTTPPIGPATAARSSVENQKLRRVKTVDFERANSESFPSQQEAPISTGDHRQARGRKVPERLNSCPGAALLARRLPACPAVTRTDVHVIAIAPSSSRSTGLDTSDQDNFQQADPATPTMQIVESGNGSYEVVWDDVPPEHSARTRRRSSSASQALEAASAGTKGLERVNTKLTEWCGTWNTPFDSSKPIVVVFPYDDGRRPHFECAIVDDEDIDILAPPNSERVSAVHSRRPSRPTSARISRAASHDESDEPKVTRDILVDDTTTSLEEALVVPDPEAWSAHLVAARRKLGVPSPERKLSNVEEADLKFRNHRDSLTLTHGRLVDSSGVRPELFAYGDSIKVAKKRMHARNHEHADRLKSKSEPEQHVDDEAATIPPLPVVKAHATEALTRGAPTLILRHAKSASGRHIRIEESV